MKQITMKELQTNISWLSDLPIELTRYGKVVAVIMPPISNKDLIMETLPVKKNIKNIQKAPAGIIKTVDDIPQLTGNMALWRCSHGVPGKLCKKIACQQEARKHER